MKVEDFQKIYNNALEEKLEERSKFMDTMKKEKNSILFTNKLSEHCVMHSDKYIISENEELNNLKAELKKADEKFKEFKKHFLFSARLNIETSGDGYESYVDECCIKATWYTIKPIDHLSYKTYANTKASNALIAEIKKYKNLDVKNGPYIFIECKILELWKSNKIDFDTLCDITLANCKL